MWAPGAATRSQGPALINYTVRYDLRQVFASAGTRFWRWLDDVLCELDEGLAVAWTDQGPVKRLPGGARSPTNRRKPDSDRRSAGNPPGNFGLIWGEVEASGRDTPV